MFDWILDTYLHFVGSMAKDRISKRLFQENQARQIVRKTNISYPRMCAYGGVRNDCFLKIWRALFC